LLKKHIVDSAVCEVCNAGEESLAHVIFPCSPAKRYLGCSTSGDWQVNALMHIQRPKSNTVKAFQHLSSSLLLARLEMEEQRCLPK
jgi:hypothetical protein